MQYYIESWSSTSQEIKGNVLERGMSHDNLFSTEGMLTWDWDTFCKLLQLFMLSVSEGDKIFSLLSNKGISFVGSCLWNLFQVSYSLVLPLCVLNNTGNSHIFCNTQKAGLNT